MIDVLGSHVLESVQTSGQERRAVQHHQHLGDDDERHQHVDPAVVSDVTAHHVIVRTLVAASVHEVGVPANRQNGYASLERDTKTSNCGLSDPTHTRD